MRLSLCLPNENRVRWLRVVTAWKAQCWIAMLAINDFRRVQVRSILFFDSPSVDVHVNQRVKQWAFAVNSNEHASVANMLFSFHALLQHVIIERGFRWVDTMKVASERKWSVHSRRASKVKQKPDAGWNPFVWPPSVLCDVVMPASWPVAGWPWSLWPDICPLGDFPFLRHPSPENHRGHLPHGQGYGLE